jgi:hypothetical protein
MKSAAKRGEAIGGVVPPIGDESARVAFEFDDSERRLYVNGELRHTWREDAAGARSRIGIGVQQSGMTVRELRVQAIRGALATPV